MLTLKFKKVHPGAKLPTYATAGSACFDFHAMVEDGCLTDAAVRVSLGVPQTIRTGLKVEVPPGHVLLIFSRSGHGFNHNVRLANCVGVIDSDYRGEILVKVTKDNDVGRPNHIVKHGDRIAQGMVVPVPSSYIVEVDELSETVRGGKGFGSTGN